MPYIGTINKSYKKTNAARYSQFHTSVVHHNRVDYPIMLMPYPNLNLPPMLTKRNVSLDLLHLFLRHK